jgi:hypothetical protein
MTLENTAALASALAAIIGVLFVYVKHTRELGKQQGIVEERDRQMDKALVAIQDDVTRGFSAIRKDITVELGHINHDITAITRVHYDSNNNIKWLDKSTQLAQCENAQKNLVALLRAEMKPLHEYLQLHKDLAERVTRLEAKHENQPDSK